MKSSFTNFFAGRKVKAILAAGILLAAFSAEAAGPHASRFQKAFKRSGHVQAATANRLMNTNSVPGTSMNYVTDNMGGWDHYSNSTYTYDPAGRMVEKVDVIPGLNQNMYKETHAYDVHNNETEALYYTWVNSTSTWDMDGSSYKIENTYNGSNLLSEQIYKTYNTGTSMFENEFRATTTYNANGNPTEEVYSNWNGSAWEIADRFLYNYNGGNTVTELILQEYVAGNFVNTFKASDIVWHNFANFQPLSYLGHIWSGSAWNMSERGTIAYDQYGGSVGLYEAYDNGSWQPEWRDTESYDNNYNFTGFMGEYWDGAAWEVAYEMQEVLTYNANFDITERLFRDRFNFNNTLEDSRKEVYSNFIVISGVTSAAQELAVSVYPNPVQHSLFIRSAITAPAAVTITDLAGRTVLFRNMAIASGELNLSDLASGTYLLQISSMEGSKTAKIVKQ